MYFETIRLRPFTSFRVHRQTVQHADASEQVPTMGRLRGDTGADMPALRAADLSHVVAAPSVVYPLVRPAHVVSKSCLTYGIAT